MGERVIDVGTIGNQETIIEKLGSVQETSSQILGLIADANASFITSDSVLKTFLNSETSVSGSKGSGANKTGTITLGTFTPKYDGSLRIKVSTKTTNASYPGYLIVLEASSQMLNSKLPTSAIYSEGSYDITVTKGVEYTVQINQNYMSIVTYCNYASLCGNVEPGASADLV